MRKTVCITGASRGIGKAAALKFAAEGYDLALSCVKNESALRETAAEAERLGSRTMLFVGDIGDPEACSRFFKLIRETFGRLDVLVCNAGISRHGLFQDMQPEEWDEMLRTNLSSVFYLSRLAVPMMLHRGGGKIITVSSVWGAAGASCETAYSAAKGGVNAFTKALAKELAPSNIQVNAVAPGTIDTEMNAFLDPEERAALVKHTVSAGLGFTSGAFFTDITFRYRSMPRQSFVTYTYYDYSGTDYTNKYESTDPSYAVPEVIATYNRFDAILTLGMRF